MATRRDIRTAMYDEMETAVDSLVDASAVTDQYPETTEQLPTVVHSDSYAAIDMNNTTGIADVTRDTDGVIQQEHYSRMMEAQFSLSVMAESEGDKEDIYEALRTHFEEFSYPVQQKEDIHPDVSKVMVLGSNSANDDGREPTARVDTLTISVEFERTYDRNVDGINSVDRTVNET